jgi:hypothetical protein
MLMRIARRFLALGFVLAALALPAADWGRPLAVSVPAPQARAPIALLLQENGSRLTSIDESSLRATGRRSASLGFVDSWAFPPSGGLVALAAHPYENAPALGSIRFVALPSLRLVRRTVRLGGTARALLWGRPDRIVALVQDCCANTSWIATIDVGSRRVLSRQPLDGVVSAIARTGDALVLVSTPENSIGAARLVVARADGGVRSAELERVRAGWSWPQGSGGGDPIGTQRLPGLAVDPQGERAYVLQPDGPAAEIDLGTLAVSYHDLTASRSVLARLAAWLQPAAQAKGLNGPTRTARWLGDGLIAVTGTDEQASKGPDGQLTMTGTPAGLAIVDTRDWSVGMLDRGADAVTPAAGYLLATGRTWSSVSERSTGMGLAIYGAGGSTRARLFAGASVWVQAVAAGRAYVDEDANGARTIAVVELASGRVVEERHADLAVPLLVDGPDN